MDINLAVEKQGFVIKEEGGSIMLSFHGDPAIKEKYLARVRAHREADRIIQGIGWEKGKGCAVGCTLENYDHERYPIELGLPIWIAILQDSIFEKFTEKEEYTFWPERFLQAINVGVDIEPVRHKLAIRRMNRLITLQMELLEKQEQSAIKETILQVISAIKVVKNCHELESNKQVCDWSAARSAGWSAAWSAAKSAAPAARYAARSALSAARSAALSAEAAALSAAKSADPAARYAARSAESAESAARSAGWSAVWSAAKSARSAGWSAAWSAAKSAESAAWSAAWKQEADDLIDLLQKEIA